jgi:hypothetical protein
VRRPLRIIVLGILGRCPYGGQTWLYLNWLLPLQRLGHEVWYVEDDSVWPYDPVKGTVTDDCSYATSSSKHPFAYTLSADDVGRTELEIATPRDATPGCEGRVLRWTKREFCVS